MKKNKLKLLALVLVLALSLAGTALAGTEPGPNWTSLAKYLETDGKFQVKATGRTELKIDETLVFNITSDKEGYLWVIQVDPDDKVTMLLPNAMDPGNRILAQRTMIFPSPLDDYEIAAGEPKGKCLVAYIVTEKKLDLVKLIDQEKNLAGALDLVAKSDQWGSAKLVVEVK